MFHINRKPQNARHSAIALRPKLVDNPSSVEDSKVPTISAVRGVTVDGDETREDLRPCIDAAVAGGEIGEVGSAARVELGGGAQEGDPVG